MEFVKNCHYKAFSVNAWQMIIDNEFSLDISEKSQDEIVEMMVENYLIIQVCGWGKCQGVIMPWKISVRPYARVY